MVYAELMNKQGEVIILAPMQGSLILKQHVTQPCITTGYIRSVGDKMTCLAEVFEFFIASKVIKTV